MKKKLFSILLVLTMLFQLSAVFSPQLIKAAVIQDSNLPEKVITVLGIMTPRSNGSLELDKKATRAQFSKMLVQTSTWKDTAGKKVGTSLFPDVKRSYWAAPYIKIAIENNWLQANLSGKFRPESGIVLQDAVNGVVKLLGYTDEDFIGNKVSAQMNFYYANQLNTNISKKQNQVLTRRDAMNLLYNTLTAETKSGQIYAETLGYKLDAEQEVDYLSLIDSKMKGPVVVAGNWKSKIPFSINSALIYRNGTKVTSSKIKQDDVLYYSKNLKTIWAYSDKVTGTYTKAAPDRVNPESVVVAGNTYTIATQKAAYDLSTLGTFDIGDKVTLLLGKNKGIVEVRSAVSNKTSVSGIIIEKGKYSDSNSDNASVQTYIKMIDATGVEHQYDCDTDKLIVNDPVQVSFIGDKTVVNKLDLYNIYGKVNDTATKLGEYDLAEDVQILDYRSGKSCVVPKKKLAGVNLYSTDIRYYHRNTSGEITELILWDVTGDLYDYGILLSGSEGGAGMQAFGTYNYDINGKQGTASTNVKLGITTEGPAQFSFDRLGVLVGIKSMRASEVKGLSETEIFDGKESFKIADTAVVYLEKDGKYYLTSLDKVADLTRYELKAYYAQNHLHGNDVRVFVAKER